MPPSALARAVGRLGADVLTVSHIWDELAWQMGAKDTAKRTAFEDTATCLQELTVFCIMLKKFTPCAFLAFDSEIRGSDEVGAEEWTGCWLCG